MIGEEPWITTPDSNSPPSMSKPSMLAPLIDAGAPVTGVHTVPAPAPTVEARSQRFWSALAASREFPDFASR